MFDIEFWKNFSSNALATIVGVIIGIPVALWINQMQQRITENFEKKRTQEEANKRKKRILELVLNELRENRNLLEVILDPNSTEKEINISDSIKKLFSIIGYSSRFIILLRTELWRALSDGGELQWIQDSDLLDSISSAYESIKLVKALGAEYNSYQKELTLYYGWRYEQPQSGVLDAAELWDDLRLHIERAILSINNTLSTLDNQILQL